jgi:hypothetical protein
LKSPFEQDISIGTVRYHVNCLAESRRPSLLKKHNQGRFELVPTPKFLRDYRAVDNLEVAKSILNPNSERFSKLRWLETCQAKFELDFFGISRALQFFDEYVRCQIVSVNGDDPRLENVYLRAETLTQMAEIHRALTEYRIKRPNDIDPKFESEAELLGFPRPS